MGTAYTGVVPGHAEGVSPESITTILTTAFISGDLRLWIPGTALRAVPG
jgi:hypothetical protein